MVKKPKFKPKITRINLNPEQAVLSCTCYDSQQLIDVGWPNGELRVPGAAYCTGKGSKAAVVAGWVDRFAPSGGVTGS